MNIADLAYEKAGNYYRAVVYDEVGREGNRFQVVKVPAGEIVALHSHQKRSEVFIVLGGSGQIFINGEQVAGKPNDTALCKPGDKHKVVNTGAEDLFIGVFAVNYDVEDSKSLGNNAA